MVNEWVPIHPDLGTRDIYEINGKGKCRNKNTKIEKKNTLEPGGRIRWNFHLLNGKIRKIYASVVIAYSFNLPKRPDQIEVDHINRDPADNRICNLRWTTKKENMNNARVGTIKRRSPVEQYDLDGNYIKSWDKIRDAAKEYGMKPTNISAVCSGIAKTCGGFKWKYVVEPDLEGEIWMVHDKFYQVSNKGRVKNEKNCILRQELVNGHYSLRLRKKHWRVSIMVCTLFIGPKPSPTHTVDHIDRNPLNNNAENLRWATKKEQNENRIVSRSVNKICLATGKILATYSTQTSAGRELTIHPSCIGAVCRGVKKSYRGFGWKFVEDC